VLTQFSATQPLADLSPPQSAAAEATPRGRHCGSPLDAAGDEVHTCTKETTSLVATGRISFQMPATQSALSCQQEAVFEQCSKCTIDLSTFVVGGLPQAEPPASHADLDDPRYAKLRYHPGGLRAILTASTLKARVGHPLCVAPLLWQTLQMVAAFFSLLESCRWCRGETHLSR
jgi:hypothetical protein